MTFRYFEVNSQIIRPIIPIILKSSTKFALYSALIDSGADYCIFGMDIAEKMDIKLNLKRKVKITGIGKDKVEGYWGNLNLKISNYTYTTNVVFTKNRNLDHGILGQQGFFDHFDVKLSHNKQTIEINLIES